MDPVMYVLFGLAFAAGIFLLMREFWRWFFKFNERIELEKKILIQLRIANGTYHLNTNFPLEQALKKAAEKEKVIDLTEQV